MKYILTLLVISTLAFTCTEQVTSTESKIENKLASSKVIADEYKIIFYDEKGTSAYVGIEGPYPAHLTVHTYATLRNAGQRVEIDAGETIRMTTLGGKDELVYVNNKMLATQEWVMKQIEILRKENLELKAELNAYKTAHN